MIKSYPKKLVTGIVLLLLTMSCTACQTQANGQSQPSAAKVSPVSDSGKHLQRQLANNLNVDADVLAPANLQKLDTLLVTPIRFNTKVQAFKTMLLGNSEVIKQENINSGNGTRYLTADGKDLTIDNVSATFMTNKYSKYIMPMLGFDFPAGIDVMKNMDLIKQRRNHDLSFMPRQQAIAEVKKQLTSLGIPVYDVVDTYALDYQTLQKEEKILKESGELVNPKTGKLTMKDGWSKADDFYFMVFRTGYNNIPVYPLNHGSYQANTIVYSGNISVCYSHRGWEFLSLIYEYQKTAVDQKGLPIISLDKALAAVKLKYENVILTNPTTITSIELDYVPSLINRSRDEYRLVPAWCFKLKTILKDSKGKPLPPFDKMMLIDATNGDEIL